MKKAIYILNFLLIILSYYLTFKQDMLLLTISFSLFTIYLSIFSTTNIKEVITTYHNQKRYYERDKIFKYSFYSITFIYIVLGFISYLLSLFIHIDNLIIVNITMTILAYSITLIKVISQYLQVMGYKKIGNNLISIYNITYTIILFIGIILLYKVLNLNNYINIIILYSLGIITFIIIILILYFLIFKKKKKYTKTNNKMNYLKEVKKVLVNNHIKTIFNLVKSFYIYTSIIILYFTLLNKYNYTSYEVSTIITNTYFYGIMVLYFSYKVISKSYQGELESLQAKIKNKDKNIQEYFNNFINKIIKIAMTSTIILFVISGPLNYLIFHNNYNIIFNIALLLPFYLIYNTIIYINIVSNKDKNILIVLLLGLIIKVIFEIPLINTIYRMGYELVLGSILTYILGLTISTIIGIILISKKLKIDLLSNFNNILNIIYENIILCLILVLFTLVVKVETSSFISSLLVVIFYLFITILFYYLKRVITKK